MKVINMEDAINEIWGFIPDADQTFYIKFCARAIKLLKMMDAYRSVSLRELCKLFGISTQMGNVKYWYYRSNSGVIGRPRKMKSDQISAFALTCNIHQNLLNEMPDPNKLRDFAEILSGENMHKRTAMRIAKECSGLRCIDFRIRNERMIMTDKKLCEINDYLKQLYDARKELNNCPIAVLDETYATEDLCGGQGYSLPGTYPSVYKKKISAPGHSWVVVVTNKIKGDGDHGTNYVFSTMIDRHERQVHPHCLVYHKERERFVEISGFDSAPMKLKQMSLSLYLMYVQLLIHWKNSIIGRDKWLILVMDNLASHKNNAGRKMLLDNNILPVFMPPYTAFVSSPLDRLLFGQIKFILRRDGLISFRDYGERFDAEKRDNPIFFKFQEAVRKITSKSIDKSFRDCGLPVSNDPSEIYRKIEGVTIYDEFIFCDNSSEIVTESDSQMAHDETESSVILSKEIYGRINNRVSMDDWSKDLKDKFKLVIGTISSEYISRKEGILKSEGSTNHIPIPDVEHLRTHDRSLQESRNTESNSNDSNDDENNIENSFAMVSNKSFYECMIRSTTNSFLSENSIILNELLGQPLYQFLRFLQIIEDCLYESNFCKICIMEKGKFTERGVEHFMRKVLSERISDMKSIYLDFTSLSKIYDIYKSTVIEGFQVHVNDVINNYGAKKSSAIATVKVTTNCSQTEDEYLENDPMSLGFREMVAREMMMKRVSIFLDLKVKHDDVSDIYFTTSITIEKEKFWYFVHVKTKPLRILVYNSNDRVKEKIIDSLQPILFYLSCYFPDIDENPIEFLDWYKSDNSNSSVWFSRLSCHFGSKHPLNLRDSDIDYLNEKVRKFPDMIRSTRSLDDKLSEYVPPTNVDTKRKRKRSDDGGNKEKKRNKRKEGNKSTSSQNNDEEHNKESEKQVLCKQKDKACKEVEKNDKDKQKFGSEKGALLLVISTSSKGSSSGLDQR